MGTTRIERLNRNLARVERRLARYVAEVHNVLVAPAIVRWDTEFVNACYAWFEAGQTRKLEIQDKIDEIEFGKVVYETHEITFSYRQ